MEKDELEKTVRQENVKGFGKVSDTAQELDGTTYAQVLADESIEPNDEKLLSGIDESAKKKQE